MFTAFINPARRELLAGFLILALALAFGRHLVMSGTSWTTFAAAASAIIFAAATTRLRTVLMLDVPVRTWLRGLLAVAAVWAALLGAIGTASAVLAQWANPWYRGFDNFLVTSGPVDWIDTNGAPYVVERAGVTLSTVLLTFAVLFVLLLAATLLGSAVGAARVCFGVNGMAITIAAILVALIMVSFWWTSRDVGIVVDQNYHGEYLIIGIPGIFLAVLFTWLLARRVEA